MKARRHAISQSMQLHLRRRDSARQEAIFNAMPAHVALLDAKGVIVSVNEAWREFGRENGWQTVNGGVGLNYLKTCDQAAGSDSLEAAQAAAGIRSVLAGETDSFCLEYPCHSPGVQRWFLLNVLPLPGTAQPGAIVMHTNISARRHSAHALAQLSLRTERREQEEQMLRTLLSSIRDFAYVYDSSGRFLFANQPMLDLWGLRLDQVIGRNYVELGYQADVAARLQQEIQVVVDTRLVHTFETPFIVHAHVNGYYEYVYSPVLGLDGSVDFVVGTTRDISERKRMQGAQRDLNEDLERRVAQRTASLARQQAMFHALADRAPAFIWAFDPAAEVFTYINRTGAEFLGGAAEDWIGKKSLPVHPEDEAASKMERMRALQTQTPASVIRRLRSADGSFRTMSCRVSPVFDTAGRVECWIGLDMDITELKKVEDALRLSNKELESFAYSVAHDVRSPLTIMVGFGRLLEKELGSGATERARHLLSRIRANVKQMDEVSSGLLSMAGISRSAIDLGPTDIAEMALEIVESLKEQNPQRRVEIYIQPQMMAVCDRRMVHSLLLNLLGNAWKFTANVDVPKISLTASLTRLEAQVVTAFCLRDNGAGFDMAYADKLFKPFQRLHSTDEFEGTGIGLATVRKIIERHGGWVQATGELGKGATMTFTLQP